MLIVSKGTIVHDGKEYGAGEVLPDMEKAESDRLIKLGACQYITGTASKSPQPGDGEQQTGEGTPEETGESEGLHLNVDPDETIKSGK